MIHDVVFYSGGLSSFCLALRVAERYGTRNLKLLFTDTMIEDEDLYRFLDEGAQAVGGELVRIADGRTPWQVFKDVRLLGNSRLDPCSRILKREISVKWVKENYPDPESVRLWIGMNWDEQDRLQRSKRFWQPYTVDSLLTESPWLVQKDMKAILDQYGIDMPRLYSLGFPHNNCGGGCVKAGQAHFRHLLKVLPDVYAEWEQNEIEMQQHLGKHVTILKETVKGESRRLSLTHLRQPDETQCNLFDWGGCGCFAVSEEDEDQ